MSPWELAFKILPFLRRDLPSRLVDDNYLDASGIREAAATEGFELAWSNSDKVASRLLAGYKPAYESHRWWWRRGLVNGSGQVLLKKPRPS